LVLKKAIFSHFCQKYGDLHSSNLLLRSNPQLYYYYKISDLVDETFIKFAEKIDSNIYFRSASITQIDQEKYCKHLETHLSYLAFDTEFKDRGFAPNVLRFFKNFELVLSKTMGDKRIDTASAQGFRYSELRYKSVTSVFEKIFLQNSKRYSAENPVVGNEKVQNEVSLSNAEQDEIDVISSQFSTTIDPDVLYDLNNVKIIYYEMFTGDQNQRGLDTFKLWKYKVESYINSLVRNLNMAIMDIQTNLSIYLENLQNGNSSESTKFKNLDSLMAQYNLISKSKINDMLFGQKDTIRLHNTLTLTLTTKQKGRGKGKSTILMSLWSKNG